MSALRKLVASAACIIADCSAVTAMYHEKQAYTVFVRSKKMARSAGNRRSTKGSGIAPNTTNAFDVRAIRS